MIPCYLEARLMRLCEARLDADAHAGKYELVLDYHPLAAQFKVCFRNCVIHSDTRLMRTTQSVKGCPTPARAKRLATAGSELRAGVGQASREETAGHTAVVGTG